MLLQCWRWLVKYWDPLVPYDLDGARIMLPFSHRLPAYRRKYPAYSSNVGRIASLVKVKYPALTFIDIGANVGDTVAIVRAREHFPILCIEGNDRFVAVLSSNILRFDGDITVAHTYIGDDAGSIRGTIQSQSGTARIVQDDRSTSVVSAQTLSEVLRAHPSFAESKMVKIDTDGFDWLILRSEMELWRRMRPVLFFEYDPHLIATNGGRGLEVFESLRGSGFEAALVYDNVGEYLISMDLANRKLTEDIHEYYSGRGSYRYCDICAFTSEDMDLYETIRRSEISFFREMRLGKGLASPDTGLPGDGLLGGKR